MAAKGEHNESRGSAKKSSSNETLNSLVKQEIAKEGVLPFSAFWRSEYRSPFRRLFRPIPPVGGFEERTPVPALFLHWLSSLILVLAPPAGNTYTIFTRLYSFMTLAWFGVFLAGGLLYYGYLKHHLHHLSDSTGDQYQWKDVAGFRPWLGPVFPLIYFVASLAIIAGDWVPPHGEVTAGAVKWFIVPTVGMGLFVVGIIYWFVLTCVLPLWNHKTLRVTRTPFLDEDENFRFEEVITKWIARPDDVSEVPDPHLP